MVDFFDNQRLLHQAYWIIMGLGVFCVVLLLVLIFPWIPRPDSVSVSAVALQDPDVLEQVVVQLVAKNSGIYDAHVDADVGRINQPNL